MEIFDRIKQQKGKNIQNDDYTKKIQEDRKRLIPHLKRVTQKANAAYNKKIMNNKVCIVEDQENIETKGKENQYIKTRAMNERYPWSEELSNI